MRIHKTRTASLNVSGRLHRTHPFAFNGARLKLTRCVRAPRSASLRLTYLAIALALLAAITIFPGRSDAQSADVLVINSVRLDRPTLHMLGVQVLISGDQNHNARVDVRYKPVGASAWRDGLPLLRVLPETVAQPVPQQFAGTVFDLTPDTQYEIELHATDPDGPVTQPVRMVTSRTRPVPRQDPANPIVVNVSTATQFQSALNSAGPGTVITLANGTYHGSFTLFASGTAENPIVIRGQSAPGAILDGDDCFCNVLEVYGSYVHVENLTIKDAERALRFLGTGTRNNVARRLQIQNVHHGIGQAAPPANQLDFYIADNVIEGRLSWPSLLDLPGDPNWDYRGVAVDGDGHVICHNRISGFGDAMINTKVLSRSTDFYGNDVLDSFDGNEVDRGAGNVRSIHNRFTNMWAAVSLQPIYGGPAYVLRNVFMNVVDEQLKLKSFGVTDEPSGVFIYHNTSVSPKIALNLQTPVTGHNFEVNNNLFVGPRVLAGSRTVDWTELIDRGEFDFNGYFPDGGFRFGSLSFPNFASLQASGVFEAGGTLLTEPIFAGGFVGPSDGRVRQNPVNFNLAGSSNAINRGTPLPGINALSGGAPDLGAIESGCTTPTYGPRSAENESIAAPVDCRAQSSLPIPWTNRDIGGVGLAGSATYSNGTFTANGSGADIWGTADEFHFVYQSLNGDGQIVARVTGVENTDQFAKGGVMIREALTAGSRHVILDLKPNGGLEFMNRTAPNGTTSVVSGGTTVAIPHWLKLVRSGNTFTASRSSDGINWTAVGTTNVTMAATVYFGLAVTSHNDAVLNTSTFDNVSVTVPSSDDFWTNLVGVTVNSSNGLTKNLNAAAGWNAGAYSVQVLSGDGYVEFSTDENNTGKVLGLTADFAGQNFTGIDYAISLGGGNLARIYENGAPKATFTGDYEPGQKYRISVEGGVVRYYKDGVAHSYTSTVPLAHSLRVDTSLYHPGATITNVVFCPKLSWTEQVGVTVNSSDGLTKNANATVGWNAGAVSAQRLSGDGYVEFSTDENGTGKVLGLSVASGGQNFTEINYAISLGGANQARIYENGAHKATFTGNYVPGERFRVSVEGGVVRYYRNGEAHAYTSTVALPHSLLVDTSLNNPGATLTDVIICGAWSN